MAARPPCWALLFLGLLVLARAQGDSPPPADTLFTGPYGFEKGPPTWTEANAAQWSNITVVRSGYFEDRGGELVGLQVGYNDGTVGPWHYKAYDPSPTAFHRLYTVDLTLNGTGHDDIVSLVLSIASSPPKFNALFVGTASGATSTLGVNDGAPTFLVSPCPQGAYSLSALSGANLGSIRDITQLGFKWKLTNPKLFDAIKQVENPWVCKPWLGPNAFARKTKDGVPECPSFDGGASCARLNCQIQQVDGQCMFDDVPGVNVTTKVCVPRNDTSSSGTQWDDPTDWCPRAAAALELPVDVPTPFLAAFVILDVCNSGPAMDPEVVKAVMYTHPQGLKNYFNEVSFGRAVFNETTSILRSIKLPCGLTTQSGIYAFPDWHKYIVSNKLLPELGQYEKIVYIGPQVNCNRPGDCSEAGQGFPGGQVYILGTPAASADAALYLFKHELGHALGLFHSASSLSAAPDGTTPMGSGSRKSLYAAPHLVQQLGWRTTVASLSDFNFPVNSTNSYKLPALHAAARSVVYVSLDWGNATSNIFVSLRVAQGQDVGLPTKFANQISIHSANWKGSEWNYRSGDLPPPTDWPCPYTRLLAVLDVNATWTQQGLTIRHVAFNSTASSSTIKVCRRVIGTTDTAPDDC